MSHRDLDDGTVCTVRLPRTSQLWIEIADANETIYEYTTLTVELPKEVVDSRLASFLAATVPTASDGPGAGPASQSPLERYRAVGRLLTTAAGKIKEALILSDTSHATVAAINAVIDQKGKEIAAASSHGPCTDLRCLRSLSEALNDTIQEGNPSQAVKNEIARTEARLAELYPGAIDMLEKLLSRKVGPRLILFSHDDDKDLVVRLRVHNQLAPSYKAARVSPEGEVGVNVAIVRADVPWFVTSVGLAWTPFNDRSRFEERTVGDTIFFDSRRRDKFTPVPSTFFGLQAPVGTSAVVLGVGAGVGVRIGDSDLELKDALNYMVFGTLGYKWLRLHVGGVWVAEVFGRDLPETEIQGTRFTLTNRGLSLIDTRRRRYAVIGIAYTP